jgi:hypothetical protein
MTAVAGSGSKIVSDSLIPFQPATGWHRDVLFLANGIGKARSANLASFSAINFKTSAGVIAVLAA